MLGFKSMHSGLLFFKGKANFTICNCNKPLLSISKSPHWSADLYHLSYRGHYISRKQEKGCYIRTEMDHWSQELGTGGHLWDFGQALSITNCTCSYPGSSQAFPVQYLLLLLLLLQCWYEVRLRMLMLSYFAVLAMFPAMQRNGESQQFISQLKQNRMSLGKRKALLKPKSFPSSIFKGLLQMMEVFEHLLKMAKIVYNEKYNEQ